MAAFPFIQARNYTPADRRPEDIWWIILHSMESPEAPDTAENVARWISGPTAPQASFHYAVDSDSVVQTLHDSDVGWAAPGANRHGLQIEMAGRAGQSAAQWLDSASVGVTGLAQRLVALKCREYDIPPVFRPAAELRLGRRGITTHNEVTKAFPGPGRNHWDPGPAFPLAPFILNVQRELRGPGSSEIGKGNDVPEYLLFDCPTGGYWSVQTRDGGVGAYEGAPFYGSLPGISVKPVAPIVHLEPFVQDGAVKGYWLTGQDGGLFAMGGAPFLDCYAAHPEWNSPGVVIVATRQTGGFTKGEPVTYQQLRREPGDQDYVFDAYNFGR